MNELQKEILKFVLIFTVFILVLFLLYSIGNITNDNSVDNIVVYNEYQSYTMFYIDSNTVPIICYHNTNKCEYALGYNEYSNVNNKYVKVNTYFGDN